MGVLDTKSGFLLTLERSGDGAAFRYVGTVADDGHEVGVAFAVDAEGGVALSDSPECPAALADRARLVVRAALKQNAALELPPPRRITRWRPAK